MTASEVSVAYRHTPDRNAFDALYRTPHFIAPRTVLLLRYSDFSDGGARGAWRLGLPFAQTAARTSLETFGDAGRSRILLFRNGFRDVAREQQLGCPDSIPGGISTSHVRSRTSRPTPLQRSHGCSATRPSPPQVGQTPVCTSCPKAERRTCCTRPAPPQVSQVTFSPFLS